MARPYLGVPVHISRQAKHRIIPQFGLDPILGEPPSNEVPLVKSTRKTKFRIIQSLVFTQVLIWVCKQQRTGKYIGWF